MGRIFHSSILPSQKGLGSIEKASGVKTLAQPSSSLASDSRKQPTECIAASNIELLELYTSPGSCHGALVCHSYGPSPIQRKAGDGLQPSPGAPQEVRQGLWKHSKALPPTPARARPRQRAAGSSAAPSRVPARRSAATGGLEPNLDTRDARARPANGSGTLDEMPTHETPAANGSGHTRDAHRPAPRRPVGRTRTPPL